MYEERPVILRGDDGPFGWLFAEWSPSVMQGWIKSLPVAGSIARLIILDVSQVFKAAIDDARIVNNPLKASSIQRPAVQKRHAMALTAEQVIAMETELPRAPCPRTWKDTRPSR